LQSTIFFQKSVVLFPIAEITPVPVTTTLLDSILIRLTIQGFR
jgi:hypothetical protein